MKLKVKIDGMMCEHCKKRIEQVLSQFKKIKSKVVLEDKCAYLSSKELIDEKQIRQVITNAGYTVVSITEE